MRHILVAATLAANAVMHVSAAQAPAGETRELVWDGLPIVSRIEAGDRLITVRKLLVADRFFEYTSAEVELMSLAAAEELYLVRRITAEPRLVENDSWIKTRVRGTVERVFKTGRRAAVPGSSLEFDIDGGEMISNGVRILAGLAVHLDQPAYLIGLQYRGDREPNYWQLMKLLEITRSETLAPFRRKDDEKPPISLLYGKHLDELAAVVARRK